MRWDKAMIVAKKDLAEFAKNRYVLMTIVLMPLVISIILPAVYTLPIKALSRQGSGELVLDMNITRKITNATVTNAVIFDAELSNVTVSGSVLHACVIRHSWVINSTLTDSMVNRSRVEHTILTRCILNNLTLDKGNVLQGSQYLGSNSALDQFKTLMFNMLLILLIMTPVTIPTVTASYSFVGEKVNKSLEPLLATPITDLELLIGKSGSIFAVSMGATWASFVAATLMVDFLTQPVLGYYPLPNPYWIVGILLLAPGMCLMSILANVIISSKVNDVRVSQQIGGVLVMPVLLFFFLGLAGMLSTGIAPIIVFSLLVLAADAVILWFSLRIFNREEILVNWK